MFLLSFYGLIFLERIHPFLLLQQLNLHKIFYVIFGYFDVKCVYMAYLNIGFETKKKGY